MNEGFTKVHFLLLSSLSSFFSLEEHGRVLNTKFVLNERKEGKGKIHIDTSICCTVESYFNNVSIEHPFLLLLRDMLFEDQNPRYSCSAVSDMVTLLGLQSKTVLNLTEQGYERENIVRGLEEFCNICLQEIDNCKIEVDAYEILENISSNSIDNIPLRLAADTIKIFKDKGLKNSTVSNWILNKNINTLKIYGSNTPSCVIKGVVVMATESILKLSKGEKKCVIIEGNLEIMDLVDWLIEANIEVIVSSGSISDLLKTELENHNTSFVCNLSTTQLNQICEVCDQASLPSKEIERESLEMYSTTLVFSVLEAYESQDLNENSSMRYVQIFNPSQTSSTNVTAVISGRTSYVEILEQKYFECLTVLLNIAKENQFLESKLDIYIKCVSKLEKYNNKNTILQDIVSIFKTDLTKLIWLALSNSGYSVEECHSINECIARDEYNDHLADIRNITDFQSIKMVFINTLELLRLFINTSTITSA
ncbi:hypothetical protein ABK040_006416 [Willaertia magna]